MVASVGSVNGERISSGCEKFVEKKKSSMEELRDHVIYLFKVRRVKRIHHCMTSMGIPGSWSPEGRLLCTHLAEICRTSLCRSCSARDMLGISGKIIEALSERLLRSLV